MFAAARLAIAGLAATLLASAACHGVDGSAKVQANTIPVETAKELVITRYLELFSGKFLRNPVDGQYYPFPALAASDVNQVEKRDGAWVLRVAPPSGVSVEARVDLAGQWTELRRVAFVSE